MHFKFHKIKQDSSLTLMVINSCCIAGVSTGEILTLMHQITYEDKFTCYHAIDRLHIWHFMIELYILKMV